MRFIGLAGRNMKEAYRDILSLSMGVVMPIIMFLLFVSINKRVPVKLDMFTVEMLVPGVTVFSFGFLSMLAAISLAKDRQSAFLARLLTTPLSPGDFIMAYTLPYIPLALFQIMVIFLVGIVSGLAVNTALIGAVIILMIIAIACICLGMIMGSFLTENQVAGFGSGIIVVISFFGGCWVDLKMIGGVFSKIGYILPFSHAVDAARAVIRGAGLGDISQDLYWIIGYTIVFAILGIMAFKKAIRA